ncbi:hypothetical protein M413DRAFT_10406 [Hebeloma cylindrosporum]|uniref:Uncharacterized protein n=1 Tax=Hebeloma cylindrosporum TaxID=76867 RepID=A0A0C3CD98_HEBCY|nr:hypothetical protein M413DRAFT_10406 [Hebeloma cylindrosporum h7]
MSSTDGIPGTTNVLAQTVFTLCRLLINLVPLIENPIPQNPVQLNDNFFELCASLQDVPISVVVHNTPQAPSPAQLQATLPEFGNVFRGHASPTVDTPASMTAELGHSPTSSLLEVNADHSADMPSEEAEDQTYFPGFRFLNVNDTDNSPPARSPSPGLPHIVSLAWAFVAGRATPITLFPSPPLQAHPFTGGGTTVLIS